MAVRRRKPMHTLIHSDQDSQFGNDAWRRFCHAHHLEPSMSRRGNCWDNAVAESFFSSLKKERIKKRIFTTREIARANIDDYGSTIALVDTAISAGSVLRRLKPCQTRLNDVSTKVWEVQSDLLVVGPQRLFMSSLIEDTTYRDQCSCPTVFSAT
jgi:transposase InsO family protein